MSVLENSFSRESVRVLLKGSLHTTLQKTQYHLDNFLETKEEESLHQYRVTLRTARSLCREFQHFFQPKRGCALGKKLKKLQQETNEMRDIDVFLGCIEEYKRRNILDCSDGFDAIDRQLILDKNKLYKKFIRQMKAKSTQHIFRKLADLWMHKKLYLPKSEEAMVKHIKPVLQKRIKKIEKISKKLSIESENELFHTLRLNYKKIRYTTDSMCLENPRIKAFATTFKSLQTALGNVQDRNTQIARLKLYNTDNNPCIHQIIAMLEEECVAFKRICVEKSNEEAIAKIKSDFNALF